MKRRVVLKISVCVGIAGILLSGAYAADPTITSFSGNGETDTHEIREASVPTSLDSLLYVRLLFDVP